MARFQHTSSLPRRISGGAASKPHARRLQGCRAPQGSMQDELLTQGMLSIAHVTCHHNVKLLIRTGCAAPGMHARMLAAPARARALILWTAVRARSGCRRRSWTGRSSRATLWARSPRSTRCSAAPGSRRTPSTGPGRTSSWPTRPGAHFTCTCLTWHQGIRPTLSAARVSHRAACKTAAVACGTHSMPLPRGALSATWDGRVYRETQNAAATAGLRSTPTC